MYSQQWSPTPSTTAVAPELRTANRSPAIPLIKACPFTAPNKQTLPTIILFSAKKSALAGFFIISFAPDNPFPK